MKEPPKTTIPSLEKKNLNRRELLKILAASGGGLVAGAFLPEGWIKPVIEAGVLPAHAQATPPPPPPPPPPPGLPYLDGLDIFRIRSGVLSTFSATVNYHDDLCRVNQDVTVFNEWVNEGSFVQGSVILTPFECYGTITFSFQASCSAIFYCQLVVGGRESNVVSMNLLPLCT